MFCRNLKLVVFLIGIVTISSRFQLCESNNLVESPKIWLTSFQKRDSSEISFAQNQFRNSSEFKDELIHKFNQTDYIIHNGIKNLVFICEASYPVVWYVPHLQQVEYLPFDMFKTETLREAEFQDQQVPKYKIFRTLLTVQFDTIIGPVFSVNITCKSPQATGIQCRVQNSSSIHLYRFDGLQEIENSGRTVQIKLPKNYAHDTITIPCRPSLPTALVQLEKENDKWENLTNVKFNPKNGFLVSKNVTRSFVGRYRCTLLKQEGKVDDIKKEQVVLFNVSFDNSTGKLLEPTLENIEFKPVSNFKNNAVLKYSNKIYGKNNPPRNFSMQKNGNAELWCCTGVKNLRPKIYKRKCTTQIQCDILKRSMAFNVMVRDDEYFEYNYAINGHSSEDHDDCISTTLYRTNVVIFCKGENMLFGDYLVNMFNESIVPISTRPNETEKQNLWTFEPESQSKLAVDNSRRIFLSVGHPLNTSQELEQSMKFTKFRRSEDDHNSNSTKYVGEYGRNFNFEGEILIPICLGWSSFYSRGAFLKATFANGTSTIVNDKEADEKSIYLLHFTRNLYGGRDYVGNDLMEYKFGEEILAKKDLVAFECWMPQWNSDKWDKVEYKLKIDSRY